MMLDLFTAQTHVDADVYRSAATFRALVDRFVAQAAERRGERPALLVFPENLGTFLPFALAGGAATPALAAARAALSEPQAFLRALRQLRKPVLAALASVADEVRGIYTYKVGGTLEGTVNGNIMKFTWIDPGDKDEARRSLKGKGWLQMTKEGDLTVLKGEWGYNDAMTGGGVWEAEWVRDMDAEDPRSLEEWRESQGMDDDF